MDIILIMEGNNMEDVLNHIFDRWHPTGSHYICNPPVTDTDIDFVCLTYDWLQTFEMLLSGGWKHTNPDIEGRYVGINQNDFSTFRRGKYNLIVTELNSFFHAFVYATEEAKKKNILDKQERIKLFRHHLYGEEYAPNI